jgi:hypothetical protein
MMRSHLLLWDAERHDCVPYAATLTFRKTDPFAVELVLQAHDGGTRRLTFARDLLIDGVNEPAGEPGFIRVEPHIVDRDYLTFTLPIDGTPREFYAERAVIDFFVDKTCRAVPTSRALAPAATELDRWLEAIA